MQAHPANQRGANCQPSGLPVVVAGYQWFPVAAYICQLNLVIGCFKWLRVLVVTAVSLCPQTRIGMGEEQVKWGSIIDCLPWEESNSSDALREWGTFMFKSLNFVFYRNCTVLFRTWFPPREMWQLFNMSDSRSLSRFDLEKGVTTVGVLVLLKKATRYTSL